MLTGKKIILFGAGIVGRRALKQLGADNVYCFADNKKTGQTFCEKRVISFDELKEIHKSFDVVISVHFFAASQLSIQCSENGINAHLWPNMISYMDYESNPEIAKYKDIHKGQRCFIIGNGPSLRAEDLDKLYSNNEISFGCNCINKIYSQTKWHPNYYAASDTYMFTACVEDLLEIGADAHFFITFDDLFENVNLARFRDVLTHIRNDVCFFNSLSLSDENQLPPFSPDPSRAIQAGGTIVFRMLQLATYMGFNHIYLIGVDCTHGIIKDPSVYYSEPRHFYDEKPGEYDNFASLISWCEDIDTNLKITMNGYKSALFYTKEHGVEIYNATRGGILEIFERIDFDSLF